MFEFLILIMKASYAEAAVGLALTLAPVSGVSQLEAMQLAVEIHEECTAQNVVPEVAVAVAMQESRFDPTAESKTRDLGAFQVNQSNLFVTRPSKAGAAGPWDIWTYKGAAAAGCRAAASWGDTRGLHWVRHYHCGGNTSLPRCESYEKAIRHWLSKRKGGRVS